MADNVTGLPRRGKTLLSGAGRTLTATGQAVKVEGATHWFDDRDPTATTQDRRSNRQCKCMMVRNVSGTTLYAKRIVKWKAGKQGKQVDGFCNAALEQVAGVVDEYLPSGGVPANDLFWLTVEGPSLIATALESSEAANTYAVGQHIVAQTAASSVTTTAGRPLPYAITTNVTYIQSAAFNKIGRALTATTSANTNFDLLAEVNVMW